jgi:hypothetical protein
MIVFTLTSMAAPGPFNTFLSICRFYWSSTSSLSLLAFSFAFASIITLLTSSMISVIAAISTSSLSFFGTLPFAFKANTFAIYSLIVVSSSYSSLSLLAKSSLSLFYYAFNFVSSSFITSEISEVLSSKNILPSNSLSKVSIASLMIGTFVNC